LNKLTEYMSRFYPQALGNKSEKNNYIWFVIIVDDIDVGTIWFEKENYNSQEATLGIFLGIKEKMGLGIGRIAIIQAINLIKDGFKLKTIKLNVRKITRGQ
jgi:hypothetical protein